MSTRPLLLVIAALVPVFTLTFASAAGRGQSGDGRDGARVQELESNVRMLRGRMDSLQRINGDLELELTRVVPRIDQLEAKLAEFVFSGQGSGKTKADIKNEKQAIVDWKTFEKDVLAIVEPELAPLRDLLDHKHEYSKRKPSSGGGGATAHRSPAPWACAPR